MNALQVKTIKALAEIQRCFQGNITAKHFLAGIISKANVLLESAHGKGKSYIAELAGKVLNTTCSRCQGTIGLQESQFNASPDIPLLMKGVMKVNWSPFLDAQIKFFDEFNRIPPQTFSALLSILAEQTAHYGNEKKELDPFSFIATMNPADSGTFEVPMPVYDRFDICLTLPSPNCIEKVKILKIQSEKPQQILEIGDLAKIWAEVDKVKINNSEIMDMATFTRELQVCAYGDREYLTNFPACCDEGTRKDEGGCKYKEHICSKLDHRYPVSERANLSAIKIAKGIAYLDGRTTVNEDDIFESLPLVLTHRVKFMAAFESQFATKREAIDQMIRIVGNRQKERSKPMDMLSDYWDFKRTGDAKGKDMNKCRGDLVEASKNDLVIKEAFEFISMQTQSQG